MYVLLPLRVLNYRKVAIENDPEIKVHGYKQILKETPMTCDSKTAVHGCNPALSNLVVLVSRSLLFSRTISVAVLFVL